MRKEKKRTPKAEKNQFTCRQCGGHEYTALYRPSSPHDIIGPGGGKGRPISYSCDECSAQFQDPEKFSRTKFVIPEEKEASPVNFGDGSEHLRKILGEMRKDTA